MLIERVQSGFVASMDTPEAHNFDSAKVDSGRMIIKDKGRRWVRRVVASHSFYSSKAPRMNCVMLEAQKESESIPSSDVFETSRKDVEFFFAKALVLSHAKAPCGLLSERSELCFLRYFV